MLLNHSSDLVVYYESRVLPSGEQVDVAILQNGLALVVGVDGMAMYRSPELVGNELGNGLLATAKFPTKLAWVNEHVIQEHRAGYVGLSAGFVLLITLNDVQLFASKQDALRNYNELARLPLAH